MDKVLYKSFKGNITAKEFESQWQFAIENDIISPDTLGFIIDCSQATFSIDADETYKLSKLFRDNLNIFQHKKMAYITRLPEQIIFPILMQEHDFLYETKPFSSKEAALEWML